MSNYNNNFFMGNGVNGRGHFHSRPPPPNNAGMHPSHRDFDHDYGRGRGPGPGLVRRFPRFPFLHSNGPTVQQQRLPFEGRFQFQPYFRQESHNWNAGPRRRFPNPSNSFRMACGNGNNRPSSAMSPQRRFIEKRQLAFRPNTQVTDKRPPTRHALPPYNGDRRENYNERTSTNRHFTAKVCTFTNFTSPTENDKMLSTKENDTCSETDTNCMDESLRNDEQVHHDHIDSNVDGDISPESSSGSDESSVAVESELELPSPSSSSSDVCVTPNNLDTTENDLEIVIPEKDEEYEPENPNIVTTVVPRQDDDETRCITGNITSITQQKMASCDDDGFHEAFVGVCVSSYPFLPGRMIEVAGYGVWFSDGNERNFYGLLKPERLQTLKGITIHGSSCAIEAMKKDGYSSIRINLETEFLNENIRGWISKYRNNPTAQPSNWDELKYNPEILQLCKSASGTVIKWSCCGNEYLKKAGINKAKQLAKRATDARREELLQLLQAVGTTQK